MPDITELLNFFYSHWILSVSFLLVLIVVIMFEYKFSEQGAGISVEKAIDLINHEGAQVLDIRNATDFAGGHIVNAANVPFSEITTDNKKLVIKYGKKPIIVVCYKGISSAKAVHTLKSIGMKDVFTLSGGIGAWMNANLPLVK